MNKFFNCWPVIIYLGLSCIQIITSLFTKKELIERKTNNTKLFYIISQLLSIFIGYCLLFVLCHHKFYKLAWVVLFLPIILIFISLSFIFYSISKLSIHNEHFNAANYYRTHTTPKA